MQLRQKFAHIVHMLHHFQCGDEVIFLRLVLCVASKGLMLIGYGEIHGLGIVLSGFDAVAIGINAHHRAAPARQRLSENANATPHIQYIVCPPAVSQSLVPAAVL